eukprot:2100432-Prymnesium_polylepis.1
MAFHAFSTNSSPNAHMNGRFSGGSLGLRTEGSSSYSGRGSSGRKSSGRAHRPRTCHRPQGPAHERARNAPAVDDAGQVGVGRVDRRLLLARLPCPLGHLLPLGHNL